MAKGNGVDDSRHLLLEEANKLIFVKKYTAAEKLIRQLLEDHDTDLLIHLRLIELCVKLESIKDLRAGYQAMLEKKPDDQVAHVMLALADQHGELVSNHEATVQFQELLKIYGGNPGVYYGLGYAMEVSGNFDRALYNYEQCVNADSGFYPAYFGLSQVFYQKGDDNKGDYFFRLFEEFAPYNVYGNFETHRRLSNEFLEDGRYEEAELAISALSEWWVENKGGCPPEIQIYECFSMARIFEYQGDQERMNHQKTQATLLVRQLIADEEVENGVLYFVAKALEEFNQFELALDFYRQILSRETVSPEMVQKIGGQFLSLGEYELSYQLFSHAYKSRPDTPEIRFCLLVADLKLEGVNIEEYLLGKERLKQITSQNSSDRVELLSLLHNLLSKFDRDSEVHGHLGEVYLKLGNHDRAKRHFQRMYEIDGLSRESNLKYANFEMQYGDPEVSRKILENMSSSIEKIGDADRNEIQWLWASYFVRKEDYHQAQNHLSSALLSDPWNVSYIVYQIINLINLANVDQEDKKIDAVLEKLAVGEEEDLNWEVFDKRTEIWADLHQHEIVYARDKLRLLYSENDSEILRRLVQRSCQYDASKATYDFLRLLNTNFDGPEIYWALGILFKENWQLETASMWFEQILQLPEASRGEYHSRAFLELSDCYIWRGVYIEKAIEYVKIAMSLGERGDGQALTILAHAFIKLGKVKQAELYLEDKETVSDAEAAYLKGLVHYRNGAQKKANHIWKPLLTTRSNNLRFHNIKQEILKYYFDKAPYLDAN